MVGTDNRHHGRDRLLDEDPHLLDQAIVDRLADLQALRAALQVFVLAPTDVSTMGLPSSRSLTIEHGGRQCGPTWARLVETT